MLSIMERPNAILKFKVQICEQLGISHLTGKKGKDSQQQANGDPRTPLILQLLSIL